MPVFGVRPRSAGAGQHERIHHNAGVSPHLGLACASDELGLSKLSGLSFCFPQAEAIVSSCSADALGDRPERACRVRLPKRSLVPRKQQCASPSVVIGVGSGGGGLGWCEAVAKHDLRYRGVVRRAAGGGGDDLADLLEVGGSEDAGAGDREERRVGAAAVLKPVDRSRPQSGSRTGGRSRSGPRHGLPIREGVSTSLP